MWKNDLITVFSFEKDLGGMGFEGLKERGSSRREEGDEET